MTSDPFWTSSPSILFEKSRLIQFFPTSSQSPEERYNALARLFIYTGILTFLYKGNSWALYIIIFGLAFTMLLGSSIPESEITVFPIVKLKRNLESTPKKCVRPTKDNPFMNYQLTDFTNDPNRPPACEYDSVLPNGETVRDALENEFNNDLYKNVSDVFNKDNSQRQFITQAVTTWPSDQTTYANWLYNTGEPTCKEDTAFCDRNMSSGMDLQRNSARSAIPNL